MMNNHLIFKHEVAISANQSAVLWHLGKEQEASATADRAVELAYASEDLISLCYALAQIIVPLTFWLGDSNIIEQRIDLLIELSRSLDLPYWTFWGQAYECALERAQGSRSDTDFLSRSEAMLPGLLQHTLGTVLEEFAIDNVTGDGTVLHQWASSAMARRRNPDFRAIGN